MFNQIKRTIVNNPNNRILYTIINSIFIHEHKPTQLGRWGLIHDDRVDRKVDWSNEDHCGPCGTLKLDKNKDSK